MATLDDLNMPKLSLDLILEIRFKRRNVPEKPKPLPKNINKSIDKMSPEEAMHLLKLLAERLK